MHLGNNHSYKNAQRDMLRAIITEQQEQDEQNKMNEVPQTKAPEEDKNKKFYEMSKKKADEQKKKTVAKEAVSFYFMNKLLTRLYEESCPYDIRTPEMETVRKNIVANFIRENGINTIRKTMKERSFILKTLCEATETAEVDTHKKNQEVLHEEEPEEIKKNIKAFIPGETESEFCDKLDEKDAKDEVSDIGDHVRTYVSNSVEKFIIDNIEDKSKIKKVMSDVQDKVSTINTANAELDAEIKESAIKQSKQKIHKIEQRKKSFFESMVRYVAKEAVQTKNKNFINETGNIDMDKVVKVSEAMMTMMVLSEAIGFELDEEKMNAQFKK